MDDPFINSNKIVPRLQPQLEDRIDKRLDTSTVHPPLNDTTSDTFNSKKRAEPENLKETNSATQTYGLPSPPDSILVSRVSNRQDHTRTQSPLETPTKVPVSTNDAKPDPPRFEASDAPLTPAAKGTKLVTKSDTEERASPILTFHSNFIPPSPGLRSSSDANPKPNPVKLTNFAIEFGRSENTTETFKFESPLPSSNRTDSQEASNAKNKPETTEAVSTLTLHSSTSNPPGNLALNNAASEDQLEVAGPSPVWPSLLPSLETVDEVPISARPSDSLNPLKPLNTRNISDEKPTVLEPSTASAPVDVALSPETLNQKPLPIFDTVSLLKTQDVLLLSERSDKEQPPASTPAYVSNPVTTKPGIKVP